MPEMNRSVSSIHSILRQGSKLSNLTTMPFLAPLILAFLSTPVISSDGSLVYMAGASRNVHCFQSDNGREFWTTETESVVLNQPQFFVSDTTGESAVYVIESMDGRVRLLDAEQGDELWSFNCVDVTGIPSCQNAVEAEFRYVSFALLQEVLTEFSH